VVKQGLELKIQRNILAKYKDEEEKVVSDLIKKRKEFEQRISVCKERYSRTVAKDQEVSLFCRLNRGKVFEDIF